LGIDARFLGLFLKSLFECSRGYHFLSWFLKEWPLATFFNITLEA
jgi:hypothetical protein